MQLTGSPNQIYAVLEARCPAVTDALKRVRQHVPAFKKEIALYQAAALYVLTVPYNREGVLILEIGTAWGYSAAVMAEAAPLASIVTLNPVAPEAAIARKHLRAYSNVTVVEEKSWDYLALHPNRRYSVVFVDGDHKNVKRDLPYWKNILPGGLFVFHDWSPAGSGRECPPVFEALNEFAATVHPFGVQVIDDQRVGFAGFYKPREG